MGSLFPWGDLDQMKRISLGWKIDPGLMGSRRRNMAVAALVALLIGLFMPRALSGRQGAGGLLLGVGDSWKGGYGSANVDEGTVEQMLLICSLEVFDEFSLLKDIIHNSNEISRITRLLSEGSADEATILLSPYTKSRFLDCLKKQNFPFHISGDDSLRKQLVKFSEPLLGWYSASRRRLADQPLHIIAPSLAPAPDLYHALAPIAALASGLAPTSVFASGLAPTKAFASGLAPASALASGLAPTSAFASGLAPASALASRLAPTSYLASSLALNSDPDPALAPTPALAPLAPAPALAADIAPTLSPSPDVASPSYGPAPSSVPAPTSGPAPSNLLLPTSPESYPPEYHESSAAESPILPSKKQDKNNSVIVPAVTAAVGAAFLLGLLSYLYFRYFGKTEREEKDDKSFLTFSYSRKPLGKGENPKSEEVPGLSNSSAKCSSAPAPKSPPPPLLPPPVQKVAPSPPAPPPPRPPPAPKGGGPPRPPHTGKRVNQSSPLGPKQSGNATYEDEASLHAESSAPKTKLKPFFWDKVQANADQSMVWDQIKGGSFQFNEEMIESLFGCTAIDKRKSEGKKESTSTDAHIQYVRILDPKKSQNLAISLKALGVKTEEVCDALMEGNELPMELLQTLLKMAPTADEELKLRLYSGDHSQLGPAEQFLKALVDIPFAFQRMDALLFMASLPEEVSSTKESFSTLEIACKELRSSRLFMKLLEAILKTGNRMNDGTFRGHAQAFKLDTLLKLSDVKGLDGKTTLLHFVVQEIIRSEGVRAACLARESGSITSLNSDDLIDETPSEPGDHISSLGLKAVSCLSNELENVKKASNIDADLLTSTVATLGEKLLKAKEFLSTALENVNEESGFHRSFRSFIEQAEADVTSLFEEENRIRSLVKSTTDYFHGKAGRDEGLRLFVIVRDFLGMIDKVCKEVADMSKKALKTTKSKETPRMSPQHPQQTPTTSPAQDPREAQTVFPVRDPRQLLFPAIKDRRTDYSSSDDDSL